MGEGSVPCGSRREGHSGPGVAPLPKSVSSSKTSAGPLGLGRAFDGNIWDEDITIAQNLLHGNPPIVPPRRSSFVHTSTNARPVLLNDIASLTHSIKTNNRRRNHNATSNTWTSSSGEISDTDDVDSRATFVEEYNKIANKHGIPVIVPDEYVAIPYDTVTITAKKDSWFMRRLLRRTSSMLSIKSQKEVKLKRSISEFSIRSYTSKNDSLKDKHLGELVRLCGSSPFYLPSEYAAGTLSLPTCFRATAQYLVQRGPAVRGIFRISGSHNTVSALYNHYASQDEDGDAVSGTVRCPTLPDDIQCDEHDVASAFKKFLSGLPGGMLGKIWLFEALVSIHNELGIDPEMTRTRQTKVRARLIACAISSHPSKKQRDLICAVFGLLCMIGRAAETASREDEAGRPLPTHGLMGYNSLGIIFGPLLIGELMDEYDPLREEKLLAEPMKDSAPTDKERKSKHKKSKSVEEILRESKLASEKMKVANRVAEMLITHWRDVIRHMKNIGSRMDAVLENQKLRDRGSVGVNSQQLLMRPSASDNLFLRRPADPETEETSRRYGGLGGSPTPYDRNPLKPAATMPIPHSRSTQSLASRGRYNERHQTLRRHRSRPKTRSNHMLEGQKSMNILSPPREDCDDTQFNDISSRLQESEFPRRLENSQSTTTASITSSSSKKGASRAHATSESSSSTFKAGSFNERSTDSPRVLRKSPPFKTNVTRVNESEGYDGSTEEDHSSTRCSALSTIHQPSTESEGAVKHYDQDKAKQVTDTQDAENSPRPSSEHLHAPIPLRYNGESPSEHLERVLSIHASPTEQNTTPRFARFRATDPAHGFPTASPSNKSALRSSFSPSDEYSLANSAEATPTTYNRSRYSKDPLKRISKAEDMASLQSLAQALASSTDGSDDVPPLAFSDQALENADRRASSTGTRSPVKSASPEMTPGRLPRSSIDKFSSSEDSKATERPPLHTPPKTFRHRISDPPNPANTPVTPKAHALPPRPAFKGRLNSVKSLAAKFDNPQAQKGASPSPISRPTGSRERAATMEPTLTGADNKERSITTLDKTPVATPSSVLASYTSNPSPSPSRASMKSRSSIKSTRSITATQAQRQRRMEASENGSPKRTPAPRTSQAFQPGISIANKIFHESTSSPQSQNRKRSTRNQSEGKGPMGEKSTVATACSGATPILPGVGDVTSYGEMTNRGMHPQGGDANAGFGLPRRPSSISRPPSMPHLPQGPGKGRIIPRPNERPVAHFISTRAHAESQLDSNSPALSIEPKNPSPRSSVVSPTFLHPFMRMTPDSQGSAWQGRGASMLYAQVTSMQKALEAKNEEIDGLKKRLAAKNSLMDLGTLNEQLEGQKRETAMWRNRALVAERRLERMGQLPTETVVWQGSHENWGEIGSLSSETHDRLEQVYADSEAKEEAHADGLEEPRRLGQMGGAGDMSAFSGTKAAFDPDVKTTKQDGPGSTSDSGTGSGSRSANAIVGSAPGSLSASIAVLGSDSQSVFASVSNLGSDSASDPNDKQVNSTIVRTTMHGGGMDGVMSSEESEKSQGSNQSQGTVLRHSGGRRSTVDLMDFGSEDSGVVLKQLIQPLVPDTAVGGSVMKREVNEGVWKAFELA